MKFRKERLSELIREEAAKIIERNVYVPGTLITVTEVAIDDDLERALVEISVFPYEKSEEVLQRLKFMTRDLRKLLMQHVPIKFFPKIVFAIDTGVEHAARVEKILISEENKKHNKAA